MLTFSVQNNITSAIQKVQKKLDKLPQEVYQEFVKNTPIRSGNARRRTKLTADTILADYAYAQRLDNGWSRQFGGKGMTRPTEQFVYKRVKQIMRKK